MLKVTPVSTGCKSKEDYYLEDEGLAEYYSPDQAEAIQQQGTIPTVVHGKSQSKSKTQKQKLVLAQWYGKGAKTLGLTGVVLKSDFKKIFYGYDLDGERLRRQPQNPKHKERVGDDLTFSMCKSASIALHIGGDDRIFDAHLDAVKRTLDIIQERYGQTRVMIDGIRHTLNTNNLVIALINHHTSRANDPQTHTHALVMNTTQMPDGSWRSRKNDLMYMQECMGQIYRQFLAENIQNLGYKIYGTKDAFEIEGITREQITAFSQRSQQIQKQLKKDGLEATTENKQVACLKSRKAKEKDLNLEDLQTVWQQAAQGLNLDIPTPDHNHRFEHRLEGVNHALHSAIAHLSERSVSFVREDIEQFVFREIRAFRVEDMTQAIGASEDLLLLRDERNNRERYTTVAALELEADILRRWESGQNTQTPLLDEAVARERLQDSSLNVGQLEAVYKTLASSDQIVLWHGLAGVGKTRSLGSLKQVIDSLDASIEIHGFSPTTKASKVLGRELKIKSNTVAKLLVSKPNFRPNQLWVIDEAGMISSKQMKALLDRAQTVDARILFVGDTKQNPSIEAGSPMRSLMKAGATTFHISQIVRQRNAIQKQAVSLIAHKQGGDAVSLLSEHGYIQEISSAKTRQQTIADHYLDLSPEDRAQTLIVTGTNKERRAIMGNVRAGLREEGTITGEDLQVRQLVNRYLTTEQKRLVRSFNVGDHIQLSREYRTTLLQKGQVYRVEQKLDQELVVSSPGGRLYRFDPSKYKDKEVFKEQLIPVAVGDELRWTQNNPDQKWSNGDEFTVVGIEGNVLQVVDEEGQQRLITLDHALSLDYALVNTAYRAQGQTRVRVLISSTNDPTASQEPFYVKISRQSHEILIFCQSLEHLYERVGISVAQDNAVELIKEHHEQHRSLTSIDSAKSAGHLGISTESSPGDGDSESVRAGAGTEQSESQEQSRSGTRNATPGSQRGTGILHRTVHRSDGRSEVRQDGRIDRQARQGDGRPLPENELLRSGLHSTEQRSGGSGRGDQDFQEPTQEQWSPHLSDTDGRPDPSQHRDDISEWQQRSSLRESITGLAQAWTTYQNAQVVITSGLDTALDQLSEVIESPQPHKYEGMDNLATSITGNAEQQALGNSIAQVSSALDELDVLLDQFTYRQQVEAMSAGIGEWKAGRAVTDALTQVMTTGEDQALVSLESALEHVEERPPLYPKMNKLVTSIRGLQAEHELGNALDQITDILQQFEGPDYAQMDRLAQKFSDRQTVQLLHDSGLAEQLAQLHHQLEQLERPHYQGMAGLAASIQAVQTQQGMVEAIAQVVDQLEQIQAPEHEYQGMDKLARSVHQHQDAQLLLNSGLLEQVEALTQALEGQHQYEGMTKLAQTIHQHQDTQLLWNTGLLEQIENLTQSFTQAPYEYKGMDQLAQSVHQQRDSRLLLDTGLLEQIETLTQALEGRHEYQGMTELTEVITAVQLEQALLNQVLHEQLEQLTHQLEQIQARQFPHQYEGISELAASISNRRAEEAISQHLSQVDELVEQVQQAMNATPDMQRLAQTVRDMREISTLAEGPIAEELKTLAERLQDKGISITPKPKIIQVFWVPETNPDQLMEASFPIAEEHWQELLAGSGIHPDLAELNCESIVGQEILERLLSNKIEDMGAGQLVVKEISKEFAKLRDVPEGGFWIKAGVLASSLDDTVPTESLWGSLKPDHPRMDYSKGKPQKYEHPADVSREIFLPHVPEWLAQKVYDQYNITPRPGQHFWSVVKENPQIPINITEGGKKTLAVNSQGHVTLGLPGVNGGYRANDDQKNKLPKRHLHPGLAVFAVPGRHFNFLYDQDTKPSTIVNVRQDLVRAGELVVKEGCTASSSRWDKQHKGVDDLIVGAGPKQLELAISRARPFDEIAFKHYQYRYRKLTEFVQRREGDLDPERMDLEVFMEAAKRGELEDGYRFVEAGSTRIYDREYLMQSALELQKHKAAIGRAMVPIVQEMTQKHGSKHGRVHVYFTQSWAMTHGPRATTIREKESNRVVLQYRAGHLRHVSANPQTLDKFQKAMKLTEMRDQGHKRVKEQKQKNAQQQKPRRGRRR